MKYTMKGICFCLAGIILQLMNGCNTSAVKQDDETTDHVSDVVAQYTLQLDIIEKSGKILNPKTIDKKGAVVSVSFNDWTSGFFPGSMWYLYRLTKDPKWEILATEYTEALDSVQYLTSYHEIGFMIGSSYLNGMRQVNKKYEKVILQSAHSLSTRFCPKAGVFQSWDTDKGWQGLRGWKCPVSIDNMMNLELLFEATRLSGDSTFYNMAVMHADKTLENHFRSNHSCYHVVDYNPETGQVRCRETAQGYADESAWARGQAWALYGFTLCYRYTHNLAYLEVAQNIYDYIFTNRNLPKDLIPYWDFDALNIPNEPRDASAAAIIASALYELNSYIPTGNKYYETADKIMDVLSTPKYLAKIGTNGNFLLKHSVGNMPHGVEVDVPLNYADYYFLEALVRKRELEKKK